MREPWFGPKLYIGMVNQEISLLEVSQRQKTFRNEF